MPAVDTDLILVQRGNQPFRETVGNLSEVIRGDIDPGTDIPIASAAQLGVIRVGANLDIDAGTGILSAVIPAGLSFEGPWGNATAIPPATQNGQFWVWNGGNGVALNNVAWGGINGQIVNDGDRLFFDGTTFSIVPTGGGGITQITGTAPIAVSAVANGEQDVSIAEATTGGTGGGFMSQADKDKLDGIANGAEVNVDPTQAFAATATLGTLTLTPGGDTTNIPVATDTVAGLMSAADKATLDGLVATPGGVTSITARNGITNNGTAGAPILDIDFGALPNGNAATSEVMPYDISQLGDLP